MIDASYIIDRTFAFFQHTITLQSCLLKFMYSAQYMNFDHFSLVVLLIDQNQVLNCRRFAGSPIAQSFAFAVRVALFRGRFAAVQSDRLIHPELLLV